jgi:hypothetical protein
MWHMWGKLAGCIGMNVIVDGLFDNVDTIIA